MERGQPCPRGVLAKLLTTRGHGCPRSFREILESAVGQMQQMQATGSFSLTVHAGPIQETIPMRYAKRHLRPSLHVGGGETSMVATDTLISIECLALLALAQVSIRRTTRPTAKEIV